MDKRCFKSYSVIREPVLEISMERYEQLIEAEVKLKVIKDIAESEDRTYGYGSDVSKTIDTILGIKRDEK